MDRRTSTEAPEAGFTLVEVAASILVLAIGIVGVIGVMNGSFGIAAKTSQRSKAISVATQEVEELRAKEYALIPVAAPSAPAETYTRTVDGRTFTVTRTVTLENETATNPNDSRALISNAYKKATIQVSWSEAGSSQFVHQETLLYPGGQGAFVPVSVPPPVGSGRPLAPSNLLASIPTGLVGTTGVDLVWTPPATSDPPVVRYVVQYSTDASFSTYQEVTDSVPALHPSLRVTDLAPSTVYHFRVASLADNGQLSSSWATYYNVTTPASLALGCTIGDVAATPSAVKKRNNSGQLASDISIDANGIGLSCSTTVLRAEYKPMGPGTATVVKPLTRTSSTWHGVIDGRNTTWTVGDHEVKVFDSSNVQRASMKVTVCEKNRLVCQ